MPVGKNIVLDTYNFAKSIAVMLSVLATRKKKCSVKSLFRNMGKYYFLQKPKKGKLKSNLQFFSTMNG